MLEGFHANMSQLARRKKVSVSSYAALSPIPIRDILLGLFSLRVVVFISWSGCNYDSMAEYFSRIGISI
jgi:hypothetical protein